MDLAHLKKIARVAVVGALAVGVIAYAGLSRADNYTTGSTPGPGGNYELNSDNPVTINVGATVNELVLLTTTDMNFGTLGIHQDKTGGTKATIVLSPVTGLLTDSHAGATARIVSDTSAGLASSIKAATVSLTGAFPTAAVYVHYNPTVNDLQCSAGLCLTAAASLEQGGTLSAYAPPKLLIAAISDDMGTMSNTGDVGTLGTSGSCTETVAGTCTPVDGHATTTNAGALLFHIGATLSTDGTAKYYASGTYTGSFNLTLSY